MFIHKQHNNFDEEKILKLERGLNLDDGTEMYGAKPPAGRTWGRNVWSKTTSRKIANNCS
ncbi:hypothetical protein HanOQP8_Chr10g0354771 [Helianthus annuus]|nr:hypothetical protein HanOQP8_Chr10g0354771 [Helianthus annuus]